MRQGFAAPGWRPPLTPSIFVACYQNAAIFTRGFGTAVYKGNVMDRITQIGVDLAKNVMQLHAVDSTERVVVKKAIARQKFLAWFANLEPSLVAMEACSAAHYWARRLRARPRGPADRPAVCCTVSQRRRAREERCAGAEAICEAASRPQMRFVTVKTPEQQSVLAVHQMRNGFIEERTALVNRLRGPLVEFGVFLPQGMDALRVRFVEALGDAANEMNGSARTALT
jgi:transposase